MTISTTATGTINNNNYNHTAAAASGAATSSVGKKRKKTATSSAAGGVAASAGSAASAKRSKSNNHTKAGGGGKASSGNKSLVVSSSSSNAAAATPPPVPVFLRKTYALIESCDPSIASWSDDGQSFIVKDTDRFEQECIPKCFKHNRFSSFVRQLNFYGFRKIRDDPVFLDDQDDKSNSNKWCQFHHPYFQRGKPQLLSDIKKTNQQQNHLEPADKQEVETLRAEVRNLRNQVKNLRSDMNIMAALLGDAKRMYQQQHQQIMVQQQQQNQQPAGHHHHQPPPMAYDPTGPTMNSTTGMVITPPQSSFYPSPTPEELEGVPQQVPVLQPPPPPPQPTSFASSQERVDSNITINTSVSGLTPLVDMTDEDEEFLDSLFTNNTTTTSINNNHTQEEEDEDDVVVTTTTTTTTFVGPDHIQS